MAFAIFSCSLAPASDERAITSWRLTSAVEAVASTSPALTACPTATETPVTVQVPEPTFGVVPLIRCGVAPKPRA